MPTSSKEKLIGLLPILAASYFCADFFSVALHQFYHDWTGWRTIVGGSPNAITSKLLPLSQTAFFLATFFSLWQLDRLILSGWAKKQPTPATKEEKKDKPAQPTPAPSRQTNPGKTDTEEKEAKSTPIPEPIIFSEDIRYANVLGISFEESKDFANVKSTYRRVIAQYHPDKVGAMGPEIREIAESKAKEINHAYQYFRKKFKADSSSDQ